jgi:hypothetical protein
MVSNLHPPIADTHPNSRPATAAIDDRWFKILKIDPANRRLANANR